MQNMLTGGARARKLRKPDGRCHVMRYAHAWPHENRVRARGTYFLGHVSGDDIN